MTTTRDEYVSAALAELSVPAHADGFEDRLHGALATAAPAVRRAYYRRRAALVAAVAAVTLVLAAGAGWAAFRGFPATEAPRPLRLESVQPTAPLEPIAPLQEETVQPEPVAEEPGVPEAPSAEEAEELLLGVGASERYPKSVLRAHVFEIVEADEAWWVYGWVDRKWDQPLTDPLTVFLRRPHGQEKWTVFCSGTNLSDLIPKMPEAVQAAYRKKHPNPWPIPYDASEWPTVRLVEDAASAAGDTPGGETLPGSQLLTSAVRIAEGDDGRWWASVLVTAADGVSKGRSVRVYLLWSEEEGERPDHPIGFVYVGHSGDPASLESIPAEVRARL